MSDITTPFWKMHIYGGPGVGKTVFATGSKTMKTFIFDVDEGVNSAKAFHTKNDGRPENVFVWPVVVPEDFYEGMDWLRANMTKEGINLIVVDTATELQNILLDQIMTKAKVKKAGYDEWGAIKNAMNTICIHIRRIPADVIFIGHETDKSKEDEPSIWRPLYDGAFATGYAKHFSLIGRFVAVTKEIRQGEGKNIRTSRALAFTLDPTRHSKDRSTMLAQFEEPNIDALFAKIRSSTVNPDPEIETLETETN